MNSQLNLAKNRLFDSDALDLINFKIFPGTNRDVTIEQFAEQINISLSRIEAGDFEVVE